MGCGSSRSAVAVIDSNNNAGDAESMKKSDLRKTKLQSSSSKTNLKNDILPRSAKSSHGNVELFQAVSSSKSSLQKNQEIENVKNEKNKNINRTSSVTSIKSSKSQANENKKPSTASSTKSKDSGVFDENERQSSAKSHTSSQSTATEPLSGKKSSSARHKLLRIKDQELENLNDNEFNIVERPKTRLGNVAFDLFVDTPETGNMKKKPDLLPVIQSKRKRSKKIKTKEEIEQKMREVEERRKIQKLEKQMKAKQFQHLTVHTTVQIFKPCEDEEDTVETLEKKEIFES